MGKGVAGRPVVFPLAAEGISVGIYISQAMIDSSNQLLKHVVEKRSDYNFKVHTQENVEHVQVIL